VTDPALQEQLRRAKALCAFYQIALNVMTVIVALAAIAISLSK
jgi:hypothetical protein